jgi:hypothetical protein
VVHALPLELPGQDSTIYAELQGHITPEPVSKSTAPSPLRHSVYTVAKLSKLILRSTIVLQGPAPGASSDIFEHLASVHFTAI